MNKRVLELAEPDSRAIEETACAKMRCVMACYELLRRILNENLFEPKAVRFNAPLILTHAFSLMYVITPRGCL